MYLRTVWKRFEKGHARDAESSLRAYNSKEQDDARSVMSQIHYGTRRRPRNIATPSDRPEEALRSNRGDYLLRRAPRPGRRSPAISFSLPLEDTVYTRVYATHVSRGNNHLTNGTSSLPIPIIDP